MTSPQTGLRTISTDTTCKTTPGFFWAHASTKTWKSPCLRRPEKACKISRCLPKARGDSRELVGKTLLLTNASSMSASVGVVFLSGNLSSTKKSSSAHIEVHRKRYASQKWSQTICCSGDFIACRLGMLNGLLKGRP